MHLEVRATRMPRSDSMFVFYENWATKTHWEAHNESEHIAAFMAKAEELVDNSELIQLRPYGDIAAVK